MTKQEAIDKYLGSPFMELWVVTNQLENSIEGTELWNLYPNYEDALRWINLSEEFYKNVSTYYKEVERTYDESGMLTRFVMEHRSLGEAFTVKDTFIIEKHSLIGS